MEDCYNTVELTDEEDEEAVFIDDTEDGDVNEDYMEDDGDIFVEDESVDSEEYSEEEEDEYEGHTDEVNDIFEDESIDSDDKVEIDAKEDSEDNGEDTNFDHDDYFDDLEDDDDDYMDEDEDEDGDSLKDDSFEHSIDYMYQKSLESLDEEDAEPEEGEEDEEDAEPEEDEELEVVEEDVEDADDGRLESIIDEVAKENMAMTNNEVALGDFLKLDQNAYKITYGFVKFSEINFTRAKMDSREETKKGLMKSIKESGILTPIHVMITKEYGEWLKSDKSTEFKGYKYSIIDGFRRVFNAVKVGLRGCYATIWNFNDKDLGDKYALPLGVMLNRNQKYSWSELNDLLKALRDTNPISNKCLEWLLQMPKGDLAKFEEIMDCEYKDVKDALLSNKKTIQQVYNMLKKEWENEDEGERDDNMALSDINKNIKNEDTIAKANKRVIADGEEYVDDDLGEDSEKLAPLKEPLSDNEVKEILGLADKLADADDETVLKAAAEMIKEPAPKRQDPKNRKPLDPHLKLETLQRDGYQCVCCGEGKDLPIEFAKSILQSHHVISVANGGPDTKDNIITVCQNCHTMIHTMLWNQGIFTSKDFSELPDTERAKMRKRLQYATADYEAARKKGKTAKEVSEQNKDHSKFKMPGTDLRENNEATKGLDMALENEKYRTLAKTSEETVEDIENEVNSDDED